MALSANNDTNFGGTLINQKYKPLDNIVISGSDKTFYVELFNRRIRALASMLPFPKKLSLFTTAWPPAPDIDTAPMVVISTKRAQWIKTLLDNAVEKNNVEKFTGYNDLNTFISGPVAWYAPLRSKRPLFIVVHYAEYKYYKKL